MIPRIGLNLVIHQLGIVADHLRRSVGNYTTQPLAPPQVGWGGESKKCKTQFNN